MIFWLVALGVPWAAFTAFGIEVLDVRIKQVDLLSEVQASVFARMRAERERIAKRYRAEERKERARFAPERTRSEKSCWPLLMKPRNS